jgi:hypothetical protein
MKYYNFAAFSKDLLIVYYDFVLQSGDKAWTYRFY